MNLLLDTTMLVHALRRQEIASAMLADAVRSGHTLGTSAINVGEVYAGSRKEEESRTKAFLDSLECYPVTKSIGELGGRLRNEWLRKGRTIGLLDALIAATAIEHRLTLVTDNRRDFPMAEIRFYPPQ